MKKIIICAAAALAVSLVSCKEGENYGTYPVVSANYIVDLETGECSASLSNYKFYINYTQSVGSLSCDNLLINNVTYNLTTTETPSATTLYGIDLKNLKGSAKGSSSYEFVSNKCTFTTGFYLATPSGTKLPQAFSDDFLAANYRLGDKYWVRTFNPGGYYVGTTYTTYPGAEGVETAQSTSISYGLVLNFVENTADLYIYNAKFSNNPNEPDNKNILVGNLSMELTYNGIVISGEDVVPGLYEGGDWTDYPAFSFNKILVELVGEEMTTVQVNYTVAGRFTGAFTGTCVPNSKFATQE